MVAKEKVSTQQKNIRMLLMLVKLLTTKDVLIPKYDWSLTRVHPARAVIRKQPETFLFEINEFSQVKSVSHNKVESRGCPHFTL